MLEDVILCFVKVIKSVGWCTLPRLCPEIHHHDRHLIPQSYRETFQVHINKIRQSFTVYTDGE